MLGLDGLASAAYGPEAALTILIPLGAAGLAYSGLIIGVIVAILLILYFLTARPSLPTREGAAPTRWRERTSGHLPA